MRTPHALERLTAELCSGEDGEYLDAVIKETMHVAPWDGPPDGQR